ncbi:diguanylate cyclase domain-containing protein [Pseudomonas abyssi]|uniref:diguanylate cyclase domain-containing protein n=1 Tax=Pseudomonas abyssi TaxID=170540 RepID=UPI003C7BCB67
MNPAPVIPHDKLLDLLLDVVCVVNKEGRFLSVSAASERVFGYTPEELIGRTAFELIHPDDQEATRQIIEHITAGQPSSDHENRYIHKQGHIVHIMWSTQWFAAEQVRVGVARDITARKQAEARQAAVYAVSAAAHLAETLPALYQQMHHLIAQHLPVQAFSVALYDAELDQLSFPYQAGDGLTAPAPAPLAAYPSLARTIRSSPHTPKTENNGQSPQLCVPLLHDGVPIGVLVVQGRRGSPVFNARDTEFLNFVASQLATAISRHRAHDKLSFLAQHDQLTQLPNRVLLMDRLQGALLRAQRTSGQLAVLYLDLDSFKQINDTYGHGVGDQLLQQVAVRLRQSVRESDSCGRLGGDEFAVLLDSIRQRQDAASVAEKILSTLAAPFLIEGQTLICTPSVGIAVYPEHGQSERQLMHHADNAMYAAKRNGGAGYAFSPDAPA